MSATDLILRLLEHEVPEYGLVHLLDLQEEQLEIIEMLLGSDSPVTGRRVGDLSMPAGSLLISVLRGGKGFVPGPDTVLEVGDEVLAVLDPGHEDDLKELFGPIGGNGNGLMAREVDFLLVGGGMASAHCAAELRRRGAEGSILLAGREPEPPYERPPLSKEYLRGEAAREDAYVNPSDWYERERGRAADRRQRDVARPGGADGEAAGRRGGGLRQGAARPPGRWSTSSGSRAPRTRGSTTCAPSATPTRSAPTPRRPSTWC